MAWEDFCEWIGFVDMPETSNHHRWLYLPNALENGSAFHPHLQLFWKVEWIRLKSSPKSIHMAFKDPAFADRALSQFGNCGNEMIAHLPNPPHPFPTFPLREGKSGKGSRAFCINDPFPSLGKGGKGSI